MKKLSIVATCIFVLNCVGSRVIASVVPVVSNLRAEFRNGQVFLHWDERQSNRQNMQVYIAKEPITLNNVSKAQLLTDKLEPHSARDWFDDPNECPATEGPVHGWIIESGKRPLDPCNGLFVHTVVNSDPCSAYFAVLANNEDNSSLKVGVNSLNNPLNVHVQPMQAIWQLQGSQPAGDGKPLVISLHSHQSRPKGVLTHLIFGDKNMGWREGLPFKFKVTVHSDVVLLEPYDRVWINRKMSFEEAKANGSYDTKYKNIESWWFGTNDKIYDPDQAITGTPVNYTEKWLLWTMQWVEKKYQTDPEKVYAFGASMGTGVLRMVLQNPDKFASVDLLVPILDPFAEGRVGDRMKPRIGRPESICSDAVPLRDRVNTINTIKCAKTVIPPTVIRIGRADSSVTWNRKPVFIRTMQEQRQALFAGWDNGSHSSAMRKSQTGFPSWFDFKWHTDHFARNKSFPVFTKCSIDQNAGNGDPNSGDIVGFINRGFDWEGIDDRKDQYKIKLKIELPTIKFPVFVDVTPSHCQFFRPEPGVVVKAFNLDFTGKVIESKTLYADDTGRLTYDQFTISSSYGNTLLFELK